MGHYERNQASSLTGRYRAAQRPTTAKGTGNGHIRDTGYPVVIAPKPWRASDPVATDEVRVAPRHAKGRRIDGQVDLLACGLPQLFSNVTTAYDLQRHNGVEKLVDVALSQPAFIIISGALLIPDGRLAQRPLALDVSANRHLKRLAWSGSLPRTF
ncbi:MAG: hypothetical protein ABI411_07520 [Tahibacter sp.]